MVEYVYDRYLSSLTKSIAPILFSLISKKVKETQRGIIDTNQKIWPVHENL